MAGAKIVAPEIDVDAMRSQASRASSLLGAMRNEKRLLILCQLVGGELSVNELAVRLGTRQSTISQHLALLRRDGLVVARVEGQAHFYSLAGREARAILETLQTLYCEPPSKDT